MVSEHQVRAVAVLIGPRVASLRLEVDQRRIEAGNSRNVQKDATAEIDIRLEVDRRQVPANPELVLQARGRRPAPGPDVAMRVRVGEDERPRRRDRVEIGAVIGFLDVTVDDLEVVIRAQGVVATRQPLVAIVEVLLQEAVTRGVENPVGARIAAVVAVDVVRTMDRATGSRSAPPDRSSGQPTGARSRCAPNHQRPRSSGSCRSGDRCGPGST